MNYRHAYHAGNFADVLKHVTLALIIAHLKQKPAPFRVIDTHAGAGLYALDGPEAQRTGEWRLGIGRLLDPAAPALPAEVTELMGPYLTAIRSFNPDGEVRRYPGSPALALALMRADDRLIANELHPEDAAALRSAIARDRRAKVLEVDAWQALRALLPPKERRGVVLVDPPFEEAGDLDRLAAGLADGVRRFATGVYLLWLPVKDRAATDRFLDRLSREGHEKLLYAELRVRAPDADGKLAATALVVLNPPYGLEAALARVLACLAERLAQGRGAGYELRPIGGGTR